MIPKFPACDAMMVPFAILGKTGEGHVGDLGYPEFPVACYLPEASLTSWGGCLWTVGH